MARILLKAGPAGRSVCKKVTVRMEIVRRPLTHKWLKTGRAPSAEEGLRGRLKEVYRMQPRPVISTPASFGHAPGYGLET